MTFSLPKVALLALLPLAGFAVVHLLSRDLSRPNVEILTEMSLSYAAESQRTNSVLPSNMVQQPVAEGTIYQGQLTPFLAWDEEGAKLAYLPDTLTTTPAVATDAEPTPADVFEMAGDAKRYQKYCQSCHGDQGQGNAQLTAYGFPQPPNIVSGRATTLSDAAIADIVVHGQGKMQPLAGRIPAADIQRIVRHLRLLQKGAKP